MNPIRIQRKRIKGWQKPENTVNCTRNGKGNGILGNPFFIPNEDYLCFNCGRKGYVVLHYVGDKPSQEKQQLLVDCFKEWIGGKRCFFERELPNFEETKPYTKDYIKTFAGQNMMCFCGLDKPCHVDYLLQIANE
jgi:hypothetical protein